MKRKKEIKKYTVRLVVAILEMGYNSNNNILSCFDKIVKKNIWEETEKIVKEEGFSMKQIFKWEDGCENICYCHKYGWDRFIGQVWDDLDHSFRLPYMEVEKLRKAVTHSILKGTELGISDFQKELLERLPTHPHVEHNGVKFPLYLTEYSTTIPYEIRNNGEVVWRN